VFFINAIYLEQLALSGTKPKKCSEKVLMLPDNFQKKLLTLIHTLFTGLI